MEIKEKDKAAVADKKLKTVINTLSVLKSYLTDDWRDRVEQCISLLTEVRDLDPR